uniref:Major facilitator superfamily (MFS) profile domain-containing protein n=1 Tax=Panagrolaimus sp. JU765 TaxID=591449 RepID=A0AC34Q037_9BILA
MLMWSVAIGTLIGTFPFNMLYTYFGAKYVFFIAGIISSISTILTPLAAGMGFGYFLGMRFLQGIAYSADFAAIGVICVRWASLKQNAFFVSVLTCYTSLSTAITNPIAGVLCESSWGWPGVYYVHGCASLILFTLWLFFYTDHPETHPSVSIVEIEKIHRDKTEGHKNMDTFVPYWEICKNPIILIVWLNALTDIVSAMFLVTYIPTYLNKVLNYNIAHAGLLGALPGLVHIPFKTTCGYLSDKIKTFDEKPKMIFFNTLALGVTAAMYATMGYLPIQYPILAVLVLTLIKAFIGATCGGFYKCGLLVSSCFFNFVKYFILFYRNNKTSRIYKNYEAIFKRLENVSKMCTACSKNFQKTRSTKTKQRKILIL